MPYFILKKDKKISKITKNVAKSTHFLIKTGRIDKYNENKITIICKNTIEYFALKKEGIPNAFFIKRKNRPIILVK